MREHGNFHDHDSGEVEQGDCLRAISCSLTWFDAVLVYRFDRFARSTKDLIDALSNFQTLGIDFISLNEGIDTTTPTGKFVFTVMAGLAEFEKTIIVERVRMGLAHARAKGIRLGRPRAEIDKKEVLAMRKNGESIRAIANKLEISKSYVQRELKINVEAARLA